MANEQAPFELPMDGLDAVIFDLDDVITDTASVQAGAWKLMFDRFLADRGDRGGKPGDRLRESGHRTAIISASRNCAHVLEAAGIAELFDAKVDGVDAEGLGLPGKPDPAVLLEAASRLGVDPARAAVVEDALAGVEAGRRGRFGLVIGVDRGGHGEALRERGADAVVGDLGEVRVCARLGDGR